MDYFNKNLIASLQAIGERLAGICNDLRHLNTTISKTSETANKNQNAPTEVVAKAHLPEGVEVRKSASDASDEKKHQRHSLVVQWLTFLALIVYSIITGCIYRATNKAANAAADAAVEAKASRLQAQKSLDASIAQFHLDQRAWIGISDIRGTPTEGEALEIVVVFRNTGKTFAKKITGVAVPDPVKRGGGAKVFLFQRQAFSRGDYSAWR